MKTSAGRLAAVLVTLGGIFVAPGCSDSDAVDSGQGGSGTGGAGHHHDHGPPHPDCAAISDACHGVDEMGDRAAECHELGHDNDAAVCAAQKASCVDYCNALGAGGGGAGGSG